MLNILCHKDIHILLKYYCYHSYIQIGTLMIFLKGCNFGDFRFNSKVFISDRNQESQRKWNNFQCNKLFIFLAQKKQYNLPNCPPLGLTSPRIWKVFYSWIFLCKGKFPDSFFIPNQLNNKYAIPRNAPAYKDLKLTSTPNFELKYKSKLLWNRCQGWDE